MRISDWSSDVCSSDLLALGGAQRGPRRGDGRLCLCQGIAQPHLVDGEEQLPFLHDLPVMNSDRVHPPRNIGGKRNDIGAKLSVARLRPIGIVIVEMTKDQSREQIGRAAWREGVCQYVCIWMAAVP